MSTRKRTGDVSWWDNHWDALCALIASIVAFVVLFLIKNNTQAIDIWTILGIFFGVLGLIFSLLSWAKARSADLESKEIRDSFLFHAAGFRGLGALLNTRILAEPKFNCKIDLALLSPAFGGLYDPLDDRSVFQTYKLCLSNLLTGGKARLRLLFPSANVLINWYSQMFILFALDPKEDTDLEQIPQNCAKALEQLMSLLDAWPSDRVEIKTIETLPLQIFIRQTGGTKMVMYAIMGTDFPQSASKMIHPLSYNAVEAFSVGFLSSASSITGSYGEMYKLLWGKGSPLTTSEMRAYLNQVSGSIRDIKIVAKNTKPATAQPVSAAPAIASVLPPVPAAPAQPVVPMPPKP